jgi:hypothetical protein
VHAVNLPSRQVGGDYYDVVTVPDGSFLVAIADVAGKGVPAALLSSMLQAALRTQALLGGVPGAILRNVNALVYRSTAVHQFATFFLARVTADGRRDDVRERRAQLAGAAARGTARASGCKCGGTILGIMEDVAMDRGLARALERRRAGVLHDGISEATNADGELYGEERLVDVRRRLPPALNPRAIAMSILREIERHLDRLEAQDDRSWSCCACARRLAVSFPTSTNAIRGRGGVGSGRSPASASVAVHPQPLDELGMARVLRRASRRGVHAQEHQPRGPLLDRGLEPLERLIHVAEARVQRGDPPGGHDARRACGLERFEHAPSPRAVSPRGRGQCARGQTTVRATVPPAGGPPRTGEQPRRTARALRENGRGRCGAVEARVQLDRPAIVEDRLRVLASVVVRVARRGVQDHRTAGPGSPP